MRTAFAGWGIQSVGLLVLATIPGSGPALEDGKAGPELAVVAELVNRHRQRVGCDALVWNQRIAAVAAAHSRDMAIRGYYDHVDPDGEGLQHRLTRGGIGWNGIAGENLAIGTVDGRTVYALWIDSPPHRANIENCAFTHHGIGLEDGLWTHVFVQNPLGAP
ncbi:MAG: CAP domain-containing protein [Gemmatimonadota bacterium]